MRPSRLLLAFLTSAVLHAALLSPPWRGQVLEVIDAEEDTGAPLDASGGGDDGEEPPIEVLENLPFHVTLYEEPPVVAASAAVPEPPPVESPPQEPSPPSPALVPVPVPLPVPVVAEAPAPVATPEPPPPPEEAPAPEVVLTDAEREALAAMERGEEDGSAPTADDEGDAFERGGQPPSRGARRANRGQPRERRERKPACPESEQRIARVAEAHWYIDRDLIEYYATNLVELQKLGSVWTHRDASGKLDGFKVGLARCSVLRQGGLRSGDVVHDINGRRIHTVLQAVGAYIALRAEPELRVRISRRGEPLVLSYTVEQPQRRGPRKGTRQAAR